MVTADHRINRKCTLGHFYNSRDPTPDWLANFAIAKNSAGSIFTDSQNFGPRNNNPLYGIPELNTMETGVSPCRKNFEKTGETIM